MIPLHVLRKYKKVYYSQNEAFWEGPKLAWESRDLLLQHHLGTMGWGRGLGLLREGGCDAEISSTGHGLRLPLF